VAHTVSLLNVGSPRSSTRTVVSARRSARRSGRRGGRSDARRGVCKPASIRVQLERVIAIRGHGPAGLLFARLPLLDQAVFPPGEPPESWWCRHGGHWGSVARSWSAIAPTRGSIQRRKTAVGSTERAAKVSRSMHALGPYAIPTPRCTIVTTECQSVTSSRTSRCSPRSSTLLHDGEEVLELPQLHGRTGRRRTATGDGDACGFADHRRPAR
jgi:hypothetical protein